MPDYTVSADVDSMLRSANDAAIRSAIGVGTTDVPTFAGLTSTGEIVGRSGSYGIPTLRGGAGNAYQWIGASALGVVTGGGITTFQTGTNAGVSYIAVGDDITLYRDAAGILAQRNGVNAQAFRVYDTYDTAGTNYERGTFGFPVGTNTLRIGTEQAGTGAAQPIDFVVGGTRRGGFLTNGKFDATIVSNLAYIGSIINTNDSKIFWDFSTTSEVATFARLQTTPIMQFAGTDATCPALKRSTTKLQVVLANDSGFTNIQGKLTTDTAYTATVVTPTGFLTLYDSTGTAYRVPCVV